MRSKKAMPQLVQWSIMGAMVTGTAVILAFALHVIR
jgi:hypothetical protein